MLDGTPKEKPPGDGGAALAVGNENAAGAGAGLAVELWGTPNEKVPMEESPPADGPGPTETGSCHSIASYPKYSICGSQILNLRPWHINNDCKGHVSDTQTAPLGMRSVYISASVFKGKTYFSASQSRLPLPQWPQTPPPCSSEEN